MVTSIHIIETWKQMEVVRRFERGKSSMISYDKLKLNNNEVDIKKKKTPEEKEKN